MKRRRKPLRAERKESSRKIVKLKHRTRMPRLKGQATCLRSRGRERWRMKARAEQVKNRRKEQGDKLVKPKGGKASWRSQAVKAKIKEMLAMLLPSLQLRQKTKVTSMKKT